MVSAGSGTSQKSRRLIRLSHGPAHPRADALEYETFVMGLETGHRRAPASGSSFEMALPFRGLLHFHMNFRISMSFYITKPAGIS